MSQPRARSTVRCTIRPSVTKAILRHSLLDILKSSLFHFRPETVITVHCVLSDCDERFRRFGWDIFQAIEAHCRVETGGYSSVWNMDAIPVIMRFDNMETFFLVRQLVVYVERAQRYWPYSRGKFSNNFTRYSRIRRPCHSKVSVLTQFRL